MHKVYIEEEEVVDVVCSTFISRTILVRPHFSVLL